MKAVIIEDEKQAVIALEQEIKLNCPNVYLSGNATNVKDAYELITNVQPDLVFLDIQLKDGNGFDLLKKLDKYNFKIIFTTAYSQYALQAIKVSALDYLLKPIDSEELVIAVNKIEHISRDNTKIQIENFLANKSVVNPLHKKIGLQTAKGITFYELKTIIKLQSEGNYTALFLNSGKKIISAKLLKDFEVLLSPLGFIRIHHSHIINLSHIESYITKDGGYVIMNDKSTIPVSKRRKTMFLNKLNNLYD